MPSANLWRPQAVATLIPRLHKAVDVSCHTMRHFLYLIPFIFLCAKTFAQSNSQVFARLVPNEANSKISLRGCDNDTLTYYLNGTKVDMRKAFIRAHNIAGITILSKDKTKLLFGDSTTGCTVLIETKKKIKLLTLFEFLNKNKIAYDSLKSVRIEIDGTILSDYNIFIDSKAEVNTFRRTLLGNNDTDDTISQPRNILLIAIKTKFTKKYGS